LRPLDETRSAAAPGGEFVYAKALMAQLKNPPVLALLKARVAGIFEYASIWNDAAQQNDIVQ